MEGENKEVQKSSEQEYSEAFDELEKAEAIKEDSEAKPEKEAPADEPEAKKEPEPKPEEKKPEEKAKPEASGVEKALHDTKAWATKISQENAELKKLLTELKEGKATQTQVEDAQAKLDKSGKSLKDGLEKVYADYPELKDVLDPLAEKMNSLSAKLDLSEKQSKEALKREELRVNFEKNIEPEIVKVHQDFSKIKVDPEYFKWAEKQRPALKYAAMYSEDPQDIISAVTEYKKFLNTDESEKQKGDEEKKKAALKSNLHTASGGGSRQGQKATSLEDVDPNDYDTAFEVASKKYK